MTRGRARASDSPVPLGCRRTLDACRSQARVRRYDRENLRRKTFGGDELSVLQRQLEQKRLDSVLRAARSGSCERASSVSPSCSQSQCSDKPTEISWSVNELKQRFDCHSKKACAAEAVSISASHLPWVHAATSASARDQLSKQTVSNGFTSCRLRAPITSLGAVQVSSSQDTYPVIKPPPLEPSRVRVRGKEPPPTYRTLRLCPTNLSVAPQNPALMSTMSPLNGKVRALAHSFDRGCHQSRSGEESYV